MHKYVRVPTAITLIFQVTLSYIAKLSERKHLNFRNFPGVEATTHSISHAFKKISHAFRLHILYSLRVTGFLFPSSSFPSHYMWFYAWYGEKFNLKTKFHLSKCEGLLNQPIVYMSQSFWNAFCLVCFRVINYVKNYLSRHQQQREYF